MSSSTEIYSLGRSADFGDHIEFEDNELSFTTGGSYAETWFNQIKLQYPHLRFSLYWVNESEEPDYGYIDIDGSETGIIDNREGFIRAAKLLDHFRSKLISISNVQELLQKGQIVRWLIEPHLQIMSSPNKIITFIKNNGEVLYVKAQYNPETQQIFPPVNY